MSMPKESRWSAIQHLTHTASPNGSNDGWEPAELKQHDWLPTDCCRRIWQVFQQSFQCLLWKIPPCGGFGLVNLFTAWGPLWCPGAIESSFCWKFLCIAGHRILFPPARQRPEHSLTLRLDAWAGFHSSHRGSSRPFWEGASRHSKAGTRHPSPAELPAENVPVRGLWERSRTALRHPSAASADCWRLCSWEQPRKALPALLSHVRCSKCLWFLAKASLGAERSGAFFVPSSPPALGGLNAVSCFLPKSIRNQGGGVASKVLRTRFPGHAVTEQDSNTQRKGTLRRDYRYLKLVNHGLLHLYPSPNTTPVSQLRALTRDPILRQEISSSWLHHGLSFQSWAEHNLLPSPECPDVSHSSPCSKVQNQLPGQCSSVLGEYLK